MSDCPTTIGSPCPFLPAFFGVLPLFGGALLGGGGALLLGPNDARRMAFFALMAFLMGVAIFLDCDMAFLMGVAIVFLAAGFLVAAFLGEPFVLAFRAGILRRDSTPGKVQIKTEGVEKKKRNSARGRLPRAPWATEALRHGLEWTSLAPSQPSSADVEAVGSLLQDWAIGT